MKILLVGGGSGGSVSPLLAVAGEIKKHHPQAGFLLVGTKHGPERAMAEEAGIAFAQVTAGKFRRYFSWKNLWAPFLIAVGLWQAFKILRDYKPAAVFGAGSFAQVPVVWAAWFKGIPVVLHQQDVLPGLANRFCQFAAKKITVTFESSLSDFSSSLGVFYKKKQQDKIILTGNPFREELKDGSKQRAQKEFNLNPEFATLLVLGGGTGAKFLNDLMADSAPELAKVVQIIHSTGKNKSLELKLQNYHAYEFISNIADAYAAADIVLARAGLSTITELSNLKKVSIIVPMPGTHQEANAFYLMDADAAIVLNQNRITASGLVSLVRKLLFAGEAQEIMKKNLSQIMPHNAGGKIAEIILKQIVHP